jgi:lysophospholipase L1-like esterase
MHCRISGFFLAAAIVVSVLAGASEVSLGEATVVAFGDSTTAPRGELTVYTTFLEKWLAAKGISVKVVNAGVGGNTTADARARFEKDVLSPKPRIVIIQFGINDAAVDVWKTPPASSPRVSTTDYESNLLHFIQTLKSRSVRVIIMTPNPCRWSDETRRFYGKPPYRPDGPDGFNILLRGYAEIVRRLARREGVTLIDVYNAFCSYGSKPGQSMDELLLDGMHPNDKGHELVAKLLLSSMLTEENQRDLQSRHPVLLFGSGDFSHHELAKKESSP